jgi:hypothetical protein
LHQAPAFLFQDAWLHFNPVIQKIRIANSKSADNSACSLVSRAVNQSSHSSLDERARTHRAGLDRRVNIHSREPVIAELRSGFSEGDDFCMRCGIAVGAGAIAGNGDEFVFAYYARADRHFAACLGFASCAQRLPHPALINLDFRGGIHAASFLQTAFKQPSKRRTATIGCPPKHVKHT